MGETNRQEANSEREEICNKTIDKRQVKRDNRRRETRYEKHKIRDKIHEKDKRDKEER